ncbi:MAG: VOC family protein [Terriglobales bacterium]
MNLGISRIGQIAVNAHDLDRATAFYRCREIEIRSAQFNSVFSVPDIAAAHRQMLATGVRFEDEPHMIAKMPDHDLWMTFFRDSEQNLLALMSEVPRAA